MIVSPKSKKTKSTKNNYIKAIDMLNKLPNELNLLDVQTMLDEWIGMHCL